MSSLPTDKKPVIAVVGPTASGKTALSVKIAQACNGEVISADSRQVYRKLDIGAAKVTKEEMCGIPHHLLDVTGPETIYTAADFKRDATEAINLIQSREKIPVVAGGSFFYVELLRGTMHAAPVAPNPELRAKLNILSTHELFTQLQEKDPSRAATIDPHNRQRLIRSLEIVEKLGVVPLQSKLPAPDNWCTIGIEIPTDVLHQRLYERITSRIDIGMIEEVRQLHNHDHLSWERLESLGLEYRYIAHYLQGHLTKPELIDTLYTRSKQFAKRQRTWLRKDPSITWIPYDTSDAAITRAQKFLSHYGAG